LVPGSGGASGNDIRAPATVASILALMEILE